MLRRSIFFFAILAHAAVLRVEITHRADYPQGNYEEIAGKIYFAVDPNLPANKIIVDVDRAPRDAKGLVEFSADLYVLQPKDPKKSNGTALFEVSNRGGKGLMSTFDFTRGNDPGDSFLFDSGYTLVWVGWEFDVPDRTHMKLYAPVIRGLTGPVRSEIMVDHRATAASLGDRAQIPYAVADESTATLTVRNRPADPATTIPRDQWKFNAEATGVEYSSGFEPGKIYECIYTGKDPAVVGLGPAAIRDYISYMKQHGEVKRAIAFGVSQSGRFLRKYLYDGFNADEQGHIVFDGVWAHVAGAGQGSFNHRFAQPSRDGHTWMNFFYPTDLFPFTDEPETDDGITAALLARATEEHVVPKIFYTNGSYEYWGREAALIHISPDGRKDIPPAPSTRIYYIAGTQHGPSAEPVKHNTQNESNPNDNRYVLRALLVDMNNWISDGAAPPQSEIPHINKDQLVAVSALNFPKIPGINVPKIPAYAWRLDFGPDFRSKGIVAFEPPKVGKPFPTLIPQVNSDGNETAGIRLPELAVPLATYTGWNLRDAKIGAPDEIQSMIGSFIPFARSKAERERIGDPRPSIEERYKSKEAYLAQVEAATKPLIAQHLILARDAERIKEKASARWDSLMTAQ
ncbi:MAG TPA: alpha/beta hydrolase domain-containing protein [Bryobacteraceae bacterium]|nr:alpha/beta hydrolase domain-containing protein [Bryobacteraceae bacterium]